MLWGRILRRYVVNASLARHKKIVSITRLVAALLFLAVGNGLIYGLVIPLTAGLFVLIAHGLVPNTGRQVDGRDIRAGGVARLLILASPPRTGDKPPVLGLFSARSSSS